MDLFNPTKAAKMYSCTSQPWKEPAWAASMRVPRSAMKRRRTGEKHPRKISGSAKSTDLRQARRFMLAGPYFGGCKSPWSQRPRPLDFMGSSYAARVLSTWLQMAHSNVCRSTPARAGSILASIIAALHFGQAGRSNAPNGMADAGHWDRDMMLPLE